MSARAAAALAALLTAAEADAHIRMTWPPPRSPDQLKAAPCGLAGSVRGATVTTLEPGATITVEWLETINHPGHYRISFDAAGEDDFVDPASFTDLYTAPSVLVDGIADGPAQMAQQITLPEIECDSCTLQLVQVMTDKAPYGDGNDLYYQCADLILRAATPADSGAPDGGSVDDAGPAADSDAPAEAGDADRRALDGDSELAPSPRARAVGCAAASARPVLLGIVWSAWSRRRRSGSAATAV